MADVTSIEWCDSTFNPWMGCTRISPACDHCYAEQTTSRFGVVKWGVGQPRVRTSPTYWRKPLQWNAQPFYSCARCGWRGIASGPQAACGQCPEPCLRPARRRVFCASLADVFDGEVDPQWRADLFHLIRSTPNLDWLLLTKRIGNAADMIQEAMSRLQEPGCMWPMPNVWLGATVVTQAEADRDIPKLLAVPAAVRFLSIEPMLGPISFEGMFANPVRLNDGSNALEALDWVICGGESGKHARPTHRDWVRSLRDQCKQVGVPFLFKQWGEWAPTDMLEGDCNDPNAVMKHIGKKAAGRLLDGRMHHQFPDPPDHHIPALTSAQIAKPGACGQDGRPSAHPHQIRTNP